MLNRVPDFVSRASTAALDLLFPRECCACGKEIHSPNENGLCWDCRSDAHTLGPPWCERCGLVVAGRVDHAFVCADCREHPPRYDRARSLYRYEGGVREAIHALKYHRDFSVVPDLSRLLLAGLMTHFPDWRDLTLVPVPLHASRRRHRGFNQGLELIRGMRRLEPDLTQWRGLRRVKNTDTQTRLSKAARRDNVRGAFKISPRAGDPPSRILLLDDVMTTGATLDACALALKGADEINTLTLARG